MIEKRIKRVNFHSLDALKHRFYDVSPVLLRIFVHPSLVSGQTLLQNLLSPTDVVFGTFLLIS